MPPNRRAFKPFIIEAYRRYKLPAISEILNPNACAEAAAASKTQVKAFAYQQFVRDYIQRPSPYRGVLVYHGLGSGKTCSSIGVAESLLNDKKIFVLLPASLQENFRQELRTCGNPIYMNNNFWETRIINSEADKGPALAMKIERMIRSSDHKRELPPMPDPE